jgi:hypothetical protein
MPRDEDVSHGKSGTVGKQALISDNNGWLMRE